MSLAPPKPTTRLGLKIRPARRIAFSLLLAAACPQASADKLALVVANSRYQHISALANPQADAQAVAARLKQAGFKLLRPVRVNDDVQADLTLDEMLTADEALLNAAAGADMVLVYYAGHGLQMNGVPYLVPVDLPAIQPGTLQGEAGPEKLKRRLLELDALIAGLDQNGRPAVAIFDACREIPQLEASSRAVFGDAAPFRGLARPKSPGRNRLLAYAAGFGELANDGQGRHSPYTQAWLDEFDRPQSRADLVTFFSHVAKQLVDAKGQHPEVVLQGIGVGDYPLAQAATAAPAPKPAAPDSAAVELSFWDSVKNSDNAADFEEYLRQFPQGRFVVPAHSKLKHLQAAAMPPKTEPVSVETTSPAVKPSKPAFPFGIEMVEIPGGTFQMGCGPKDRECFDDEKPRHPVTVPAFALGKTEVTQGQWKAVMGSNPSNFQQCGGDCPVETVSWPDAQAFIAKLNGLTGKSFRLPSEAEWEYACRAGKETLYCGGDDVDAVAWYGNNSGNTTHPVGRQRANAWGLYDMSGNVWEWTCSAYADHYGSGQETDCPATAQHRVLRGGSWVDFGRHARSAHRIRFVPGARRSYAGFRLSLGQPE